MNSKSLITLALSVHLLAAECRAHGGPIPSVPPSDAPAPGPAPHVPQPEPIPTTPSLPLGPASPPHPTAPRPATRPAPETPKTGGPPTPPRPARTPSVTGPATGTPASGVSPLGAATGALAATAPDPTTWEVWWQLNQDRYIDLKSHIAALDVSTGDDSAWLGAGRGTSGGNAVSELVVPRLLALLEKERQQDVVTSATVALARLADGPIEARASEFSRAFAAFVNDPNQEIAETSVLARGLVGDESAAPELAALLGDDESARRQVGGRAVSARTRAFAGFALGILAARSHNEDVRRFIVHHLAQTLREDAGAAPDVHVACVLGLGLAPLAWTEALGQGLDAPATVAAARKVSTVATASRETEIETLLARFVDDHGDRFVRAQIPASLARLAQGASEAACAEITGVLLAAVAPGAQEPDEVVQGCTLALGRLGGAGGNELDKRVHATLQRIALGGERQARSFALIALAQRSTLGNSPGSVAETRGFLAQRLCEGKAHERAWAALALGLLEHERNQDGEANSLSVRASLLAALKDSGSPDEVGALAIGCGLAGSTDAVPVLLAKLEHSSDPRVQGHVAVALGLLGDAHATTPLRALLADARFRPELLRNVAIGLALLEDRSLVPTLVDTLSKATSLASQGAAAAVIGWIGDRRAIDPLLALLSDRDATATARGFAAAALGRVCDRDRVPWNAVIAENFHYRAATATLIAGDGTGLLEIF